VTAILLLLFLACATSARAQEVLVCGVPLLRTLPSGGEHTYRVNVPPGVVANIQTSALSMALGPRRMRLTGPGLSIDTPTGIIRFAGRNGDLTLRVSQNSGNTGGDYVVTLNIVSSGAFNCGRVVPCGATPDGTGFRIPGEVDSFQLPLRGGEPTTIKLNYVDAVGQPFLWLFDPTGNEVSPGRCAGSTQFTPAMTGTYTALVSACGLPVQRDYRLEVLHASCPDGPTITYFGIANAASMPIAPDAYDPAGRPIYERQVGADMSLVIEARAGSSGRRPGLSTVPNGDEPADLQMIVSSDLGDGDPRICDIAPPDFGGVPSTSPFTFEPLTAAALEHIHDMGCRFNNGQGEPAGRTESLEACTVTGDGDFAFVDRGSSIQYCAQIAGAWAFPNRDTVVAARVKDSAGNYGASREIVVRVGSSGSPTPTATPRPGTSTPTRTASRTSTPPLTQRATHTETRTTTPSRTRTLGPPGTPTSTPTPIDCPGDCGENGMVTINELTLMLNIAFGTAQLEACPAGDSDRDGVVAVGDLVRAVTSALDGCTP
jgi:hypothetical protein